METVYNKGGKVLAELSVEKRFWVLLCDVRDNLNDLNTKFLRSTKTHFRSVGVCQSFLLNN
jgi:hypothetical protein